MVRVQLIGETVGLRESRARGPALRLVHSAISVEDLLRDTAVATFVDAMQTPLPVLPSSDLAHKTQTIPATSKRHAADLAVEAFEQGQVMLFWNGGQISALGSLLEMQAENEALFIRLFPLKGG